MDYFYKSWNGKKDDFDGGYGVQCVDSAKRGMKILGINNPPTTGNGFASGYWSNYDSIPLLKNNFDKVYNAFVNGDMIIWGNGSKNPHVGWYYHGQVFSQNQDGKNDGYTLRPINRFKDLKGALRFKGFSKKGSDNLTLETAIKTIAEYIKKGYFGNGHENRKNKIYELIRKEVNRK